MLLIWDLFEFGASDNFDADNWLWKLKLSIGLMFSPY